MTVVCVFQCLQAWESTVQYVWECVREGDLACVWEPSTGACSARAEQHSGTVSGYLASLHTDSCRTVIFDGGTKYVRTPNSANLLCACRHSIYVQYECLCLCAVRHLHPL